MEEEKRENFEDVKPITHSPQKTTLSKKMKQNPWVASTLVLGIITLILLVGSFGGINGKITGGAIGVVSEDVVAGQILQIAESQVGGAELVEVNEKSGLYEVVISMQGQEIPIYVTLDGVNLVGGLTPMAALLQQAPASTPAATEVPKSDKPTVELFIWSYCPYGVQAQGPLAEVASLLGNYADFKGVMYYDGHGAYETQQNKIQECIQEVAPNKYWNYATGFVKNIYPNCGQSRDEACNTDESIKLMKSLGIDSTAVMNCVDSKGEALIGEASATAKAYGVSGSPTVVINGVKVQVARDAESMKTAVCNAFINAPEVCATVLDTGSATAAPAGNC